MGNSVANLEQKTSLVEYFYNSGFDYSIFGNLPSIPYLIELQNIGNGTSILAKWDILSLADELRLYYKESNAPAYTWEYEQVDPTSSEHILDSLETNTFYKIKVAAIFDSVYLESRTLEIETVSSSSEPDEIQILSTELFNNYPNPFNPSTTISFKISRKDAKDAETCLPWQIIIYNIKGQKIRTFKIPQSEIENPNCVVWDGTDDEGKSVTSGVYFYRLKAGEINILKKMMLIK